MAGENAPAQGGQSSGSQGNQQGSQQGTGVQQGSGSAMGVNNPNLGSASSVVELTEDSMVRLPGAKDPVRYGDHSRSFQSEFTKRAQETARLRKEHAALKQQNEDYQRRIAAVSGQQQAQPDETGQMVEALRQLPYLKGEEAAQVVQHLTQQFGKFGQELKTRDMALALIYNQLKEMGQTVSGLNKTSSNTQFGNLITSAMKAAGVPEQAREFAEELYSAYEGDNLPREFPQILKKRWEHLQGVFKTSRQQQAEQARRTPFVPGRGGNGSASKPLTDLKGKSAAQIADMFWPGMNGDVEA